MSRVQGRHISSSRGKHCNKPLEKHSSKILKLSPQFILATAKVICAAGLIKEVTLTRTLVKSSKRFYFVRSGNSQSVC